MLMITRWYMFFFGLWGLLGGFTLSFARKFQSDGTCQVLKFLSLKGLWIHMVECLFWGGGIFQTSNTSKPWISIQKTSNFAGNHVWSLEGPALDQGCGGLPIEWQRRWFWIPLEGTTSRDLGKKMWPAACWPWGAVLRCGTGMFLVCDVPRTCAIRQMQVSAAIFSNIYLYMCNMQMPTYFDRIWQLEIPDW